MHDDYAEMLRELCATGAEFLLVGAYALATYGLIRATGDIDLWVRPTRGNAALVFEALAAFGAPLADLSVDDLSSPEVVFQIGVAPVRIDILTSISGGLSFEEAWESRERRRVGGLEIGVLSAKHLLLNKRATGRPKDRADADWLENEYRRSEEKGGA